MNTAAFNLTDAAKLVNDENAAREFIESLLWPNGPVCPHCNSTDAYRMMKLATSEKPGRPGLCRCRSCKKQFTVMVGTIFSDSHIPLGKWIMAFYLMNASKKSMSAHQLHRELGITYKAAWFMCHRIRYAMWQEPLASLLGAGGGTVQVDETYVGGKPRDKADRKPGRPGRDSNKTPVVALVETGGNVRTRVVADVTGATLKAAIRETVDKSATIMTDEWKSYIGIGAEFAGGHKTVKHKEKQYVAEDGSNSNTAESFFALLKRGVYGTYHRISKKHLPKYAAEYEHRWNGRKGSDGDRMGAAIKQATGKRLTYKPLTAEAEKPEGR